MRGRNAFITGARGGLGRAMLELFTARGANVWAGLREPDAAFEAWAGETARKNGVWAEPLICDLGREESVRAAVRALAAGKKTVDILVNNAGRHHGALLQMTNFQEMREVFEVNFFGPVLLMQLVSRLMARQKSGAIVNIVSVAGLDGEAGYTAYGSSKAALALASKTAARELAPFGIRVNALAPGLTATGMADSIASRNRDAYLARVGPGRLAEPREIAEAAAFLASAAASFVTGQILRADGGL